MSAIDGLGYRSLGSGRNVQAALNAMRTQQFIANRVRFRDGRPRYFVHKLSQSIFPPQIQLEGLGERCNLFQRGHRSPVRKRILTHQALKMRVVITSVVLLRDRVIGQYRKYSLPCYFQVTNVGN